MKWYITRKRMLAVIIAMFLVLVAFGIWGCAPLTRGEQRDISRTAGAVGGLFGLPPIVGESLAAGILAASNAIVYKLGHKRGRRKERSCQVPPAKASA